jgi:hypothetical protein
VEGSGKGERELERGVGVCMRVKIRGFFMIIVIGMSGIILMGLELVKEFVEFE